MKRRGLLAVALLGTTLLFSGCKKDNLIKFEDYSQYKDIQTMDYVTVGDYKGLEISVDTMQVSDIELDKKIASELYDHGYYVDAGKNPIAAGSRVTITMSGTIDGKVNDGFTKDDFEFVYGYDEYVMDGFTKNLAGNYQGDRINFEMEIPTTFQQKELIGKTVDFTVLVKKVEAYFVPGLNDEFVKEVSDCNTVEEYKEYLIPIIKEEKIAELKENKVSGVWKIVSDSSEVKEYPAGTIDEMEKELENQLNVYAMINGMDVETFVKNFYGVTYEEYVKLALKQRLLLDAIGREENITLTEKEYQEGLKEQAQLNGYNTVEALLEKVDEDKAKQAILWQKTMEYIAQQVKVITE